LITGAGAPGGPSIINAVQQSGKYEVIAADADDQATGRYLVSEFYKIPRPSDPQFVESVLSVCKTANIKVILPLVTRELFVFARLRDDFKKKGISVIVSGAHELEIANDKGMLYEFLAANNVPLPEYRIVRNFNELETAVGQLGYPEKKICIKPCISNGSRGFRVLSQDINEYDLFLNYKPDQSFTTFEKIKNMLASRDFPPMLFTEYLPGFEYSIDTILDHGKLKLVLPRKRIKMMGGITVKGEFENHPEIIDYCTRIINLLNLHGPIGLQVKEDINGRFRLLEINPRMQGSGMAALGLGINLPVIAIDIETGDGKYSIPENIKWGTKFAKYWTEIYY
jgi:carbamoyl-phosphate synthase large subunit